MSAKRTKIVLVACALVLFVLLFISPKIESKSSSEGEFKGSRAEAGAKSETNAGLEIYLNLASKQLAPEKKKLFDLLRSSNTRDSLVYFWDQLKRPDLAAYFVEEQAKNTPCFDLWNKAGNRYYYAVQFIQDQSEIPVLYQRATFCFKKALELNPSNTDARIMLASCFVEGGSNPMEGVNALKAIEKTDSNNIKLQLTFAFFSVKSGQLDKAIVRFNKVLKIDSTYIEAYLHLADTYEKLNEKNKTIEMLEAYSARTNDPTSKIEIDKYIQQLKLNN